MAQVKQRKVALMGFRSVGKSSLAIQFVQVNHFSKILFLIYLQIIYSLVVFSLFPYILLHHVNQGQFVDAYDPTIENTFNKTLKIRNQVHLTSEHLPPDYLST